MPCRFRRAAAPRGDGSASRRRSGAAAEGGRFRRHPRLARRGLRAGLGPASRLSAGGAGIMGAGAGPVHAETAGERLLGLALCVSARAPIMSGPMAIFALM